MSRTDLVEELISLLDRVAGDWSVIRTERAPDGDPRIGFSCQDRFEVWFTDREAGERCILWCPESEFFSDQDIRVVAEMLRVFTHDLEVVGEHHEAQEVWRSLEATRFLRGAARLSPFPSQALLEWIRTFEAAAHQTYEGHAFSGKVILVKDLATHLDHARGRFCRFDQPMPFQQALLAEKWLKPFLQNGEFALVALGETGEAYGFSEVLHPGPAGDGTLPLNAAATEAAPLTPDSCELTASPSGDISIELSSGMTFLRGQGRWRYQNWAPLAMVIDRHCEAVVARNLLRLVRAASEAHNGALIVVVPEGVLVNDIVPDHENVQRTASTLRDTVRGMNIREPFAARVLGVAAHVDGAVLISNDGTVLDAASLISEPHEEALELAGHTQLRRFGGGRGTAAWNASIFGLAIKVSEDGPVVAYEKGFQVFRSG